MVYCCDAVKAALQQLAMIRIGTCFGNDAWTLEPLVPFNSCRMSLAGRIAVANLSIIGLVLLTFRIAFPCGPLFDGSVCGWRLLFALALEVIYGVMSFPLGWLSIDWILNAPGGSYTLPGFSSLISVPANAYLWGYIGSVIVRRWRQPACPPHC
jgi:hypothetical protein